MGAVTLILQADPLVHYLIIPSSRVMQHNGMEERETEDQREGRIRGKKATDATCLSQRYPDYLKMRGWGACLFISTGRTKQNRGIECVCMCCVCLCVNALNLSLLPARAERKCTCG